MNGKPSARGETRLICAPTSSLILRARLSSTAKPIATWPITSGARTGSTKN